MTPEQTTTQSLTLSVAEVAKALQVGEATVREGIRTNQIPSIRLGRRVLVPRAALMRLVDDAMYGVAG